MDFSQIVSISGLGGLFESIAQRPDGMIVSQLGEKTSRFISSRVHTFTTLDNISIYTSEDNVALDVIFKEIQKQDKTSQAVKHNAKDAEIKQFFEKVVPKYDKERVYISDMKKIVKWYHILKDQKVLDQLLAKKEDTDKKEKETKASAKKTTAKKSPAKAATKKPAAKKPAATKGKIAVKK